MRFVSVVVPLWLTATTNVSLMSRRMPKPLSSVAVIGSTSSLPSASASSVAAMLRPAIVICSATELTLASFGAGAAGAAGPATLAGAAGPATLGSVTHASIPGPKH